MRKTLPHLPVRTILRDGEPWFVAADIAAALDYRDAFNLTRVLDDDEKGLSTVQTPSGDQRQHHRLLFSRNR